MDDIRFINVTQSELLQQRNDILQRIGRSREELGALAESYSLQGDEWGAWDEIRNIEWLLGS